MSRPRVTVRYCTGKGSHLPVSGGRTRQSGHFHDALEIDPHNTEALYQKGLALAELGKFDEAIEALSGTLESEPKIANAWLIKGFCLFEVGRYEEAILCL